jgi:DNA polymerase-3 subunit alpha
MNADFTHLHLHTQYSLLDGAIRLDALFKQASADKMEAVAMTDHGNMFGAIDFYLKAKERGIKPILGCEVYLAPGSRLMRGTHNGGDDEVAPYSIGRSGMNHLILLCTNEIGYLNLCKIVSIGYLEGFYYKPRVDKEILQRYSEGLIATSACLKGEAASLCIMGDMDRARDAVKWYRDVFQGRYYLEIAQNGVPQQMMVNARYQELSKDLNVPLIATADCHYLKREDAAAQEVLLSIQTGRHLDSLSRGGVKSDEFYFKSQATMKEEFSFCPEAISNTMEIAKQCNYDFKFVDDKGKKIYHFPKFDPPGGKTAPDYLRDLSRDGLQQRIKEIEEYKGRPLTPEERPQYDARLERELAVIIEMGFTGYFLIVSDFIRAAKDSNIPVGPGRGSGAGSLVAYVLRITELDPIEHGLLFERFLNPERVSLPDFDVDFCMDKRDQIIQYVVEKYGKDCVAQIITFGKLQARGVIRDVGRVFGMPVPEVDKIAKLVPETLNITLEEALEAEPRLRMLQEKDPKISHLLNVCQSLEGLYRHASIHAAGLVISNRPMVEHCPLYRGKNDELVIQFDMNNADRIGLIKFDFLGLKTLTFLQSAENLVNQRHPERNLKLLKVPLSDKKMYELMASGDTLGIFQMESSGMQDLMKRVRPNNFEDIVAINALYRPGPMGSGMLDDFISRKKGETQIVYDFEALKPILQDTYGVIVYQEQVQQVAMALASYTAGGADLLRRAMGKKKAEEMAKQKAVFVEGALKNGYDAAKVDALFDLMAKFAGYGFNKSHAAAYALITCQTAFLKAHYCVEFFAALLSIERENTDKITKYIADARRHGIEVLAPDINESETDFTVLSEKQIRFGLGAIKGVGQIAIDSVLEARKKGIFEDLFDVCSRTSNRTVNKRVLEAFAKAGAMDSFGVHRASLLASVDSAIDLGASIQKTRDENQSSFAALFGAEDTSFEHRKVTYTDDQPWDRLQELKFEKDTVGFYVTGHPLDAYAAEIERYTTGSIGDYAHTGSSKECLIGVTVAAIREIVTKKGDRMAFATLEDKTDQCEAVIFSDIYVDNEVLWKGDDPIWIKGTIENQDGTIKILMSKKGNARVLPLRYAFEALGREIHLKLKVGGTGTGIVNLNEQKLTTFQSYLKTLHDPKGVPVFVHLEVSEKAQTVLKMRETILLTREAVDYIRNLWAPEKAEIEFR